MTTESIVCLYHKQCVDGTTAAAVVLRKYSHAHFFPVAFDTAAADIALVKTHLRPDTKIIYVDNAIGLSELAPLGHKVIVIDHHISEYETVIDLTKKYPNITYHYAEPESGASLAWQHFFLEEALPTLVRYVRDIDIYTKQYVPESEWLCTYLSEFRDNPHALLEFFDNDLTIPLAHGKVLVNYADREIEKACQLEPLYITTPLGDVPAYNITNYQSAAGNILSLKMKSAVILYKISGASVRCSIRSRAGQSPSALDVARVFGGGGHVCSAGAGITREQFFLLIKN